MSTTLACTLKLVENLYHPMIERFYAEAGYRVKCGRLDNLYSFTANEKTIAAARFILQPSDTYLLRNLCVATDCRRQGIASQFLSAILVQLVPKNCYCFTSTHLQGFYETLGFECFSAEQAPSDISVVYVRNLERKRGWILMGFVNSR